ncbi:MAG: class I SAM-dependent methyltransferase [Alphaproteobacteria bacterium]|nr:class I SAM-dependent methyltransferase [Alphaproteobacteria bacterium]
MRTGSLTIIDADGREHRFVGSPGPGATIRLHDRALHRRLFLAPDLAFGEAYMDGTLTIIDGTLYDAISVAAINVYELYDHPLQRILQWLNLGVRRFQQYNPIGRAQDHVAHHYDLSGALYELFLDQDRQYSCAYFTDPAESIDTAQVNKRRHIAAKLRLQPRQKVLDIGSGWGGLGLYLAGVADVDVTGVTLSAEQHKVSNERAAKRGLGQKVRFLMRDYRELEGRFDRIVSVGMFEHVGVGHYGEFFDKLADLLSDDGVALLHSIGRKDGPGTTSPWIRKYIFPGGYSPAISEVTAAIERSGLWVTDIEILRLHYAETLRQWRERFAANRDRIKSLYDERFCRMWEFYLAASETAFRFQGMMVFQMQIARRQDAVPLTRDYITDAERQLLELERARAKSERAA